MQYRVVNCVCILLYYVACSNLILDVAIVLDASSHVTSESWERMLEFVILMVDELGVSDTGTHLASVRYRWV